MQIQIFISVEISALMAEWLRRVIRNHLGSSRAGSNPVQCDRFFLRQAAEFSSDCLVPTMETKHRSI